MAEDLIEQIKTFIKNREKYWDLDKSDFRRSKNLATGNLWYERLGKSWGEARANVTHNPIQPIVDSTCNAFLRNPFVFEGLDDSSSQAINKVLFKCLREVCNDGLSYFYCWHDSNRNLHFDHLSNLHVIYTDDECVTVKKKKVKDRTNVQISTIWEDIESLNVESNEVIVLTHFKLENGKCQVSKVEGEEVTEQMTLNIPMLPILQVKGKSAWLSNDFHYRGYYYNLQDLVALLCANWSVSAERIISRDPVMIPAEALGDSQFLEQWQSNEPRNFYTYQSFELDNTGGAPKLVALNPPTAAPNTTDIAKLETTRASIYEAIDRTVGSQYNSENAGNESATAVLLRNQHKEDALSELLWNLNQTALAITRLVAAYTNFLSDGQVQLDIKVKDKFTEGIKNTNAVQLLLSISQLPLNIQSAIMEAYGAPEEILIEIRNAVANEQNNQQADLEKQALQEENQLLTRQMQFQTEQMQLNQAQYQLQLQEASLRSTIEHEKLKNDLAVEKMKYELELEKVKLEWAKLGIEQEQGNTELQIQAAEAIVDAPVR